MRRRNSTLSLLLGVAIAISSAPLAAFAAPDAAPEPPKGGDIERPAGEAAGLIVRYAPGTLPTQGGEVTGAEGLDLQVSAGDNIGRGLRTIEFDELQSAEAAREAAAQLEQSPLVLEAYPNFIYRLNDTIESTGVGPQPDSFVTTQTSTTWGLGRIDQTSGTLDYRYTYDTTGEGVTAYIVDSGIRPTHTQFTGRLETGYKLPRFASTGDCNGHGTHVAGTVGGTTYGVAKKVTLVPVRVFGCNPERVVAPPAVNPDVPTTEDLLGAIDWIIADHQPGEPAVVNMSLGGPFLQELNDKVQAMINDGIVVVVSSGNESDYSCDVSPASAPNAITVNAATKTNNDASYSNFGQCSDLYAPGSEVKSAWFSSNTATATISGTSMAAPHVAGAVARMLSHYPTLTPSVATLTLLDQASDFDPGLNAEIEYYCSFFPSEEFCFWGDDPELMLFTPRLQTLTTAPIPTISGSPTGLSTLTATIGSWVQTGPEPDVDPDLFLQWKRSGVVIPGATDLDYTLTPADVGKTITVTVTGYAEGYASLSKTSAATPTVTKPALSAPTGVALRAYPGSIGIEWSLPVDIGGTISDYVIQYRPTTSSTYLTFNDGVDATVFDSEITGLKFGTSYYVKIAAKTEFGTGAFTTAALVKTQTGLPTAPTGVTATPAPRSIQLDWTAPATLNGGTISDYVIRYRVSGTTTWKTFADGVGTTTTATVTGLSGSRTYEFAIQAKTQFGSGTSATIKRSTQSGLASLPTSLAGTPTRTTMELTWNAPTTTNGGELLDYIVKYRRTGTTTWIVFNDGVTTGTGVTISGLTRGTSYEFAVAAKTQYGTAPSAVLKKSTLTGIPSAVNGLVTGPELTAMNLAWNAPATTNDGGDVTDYVIRYRATGATTWITVNDGVSSLAEAGITGLTRNKSYEFTVAAKTIYGTGPTLLIKRSTLSGIASAPTVLEATERTAKTIALSWYTPSATNGGTITDYVVRYRVAGTTTWTTFADGVSTATSATITGLTRLKSYDVNVAARTLAGSTSLTGSSVTLRVSTLSGAPAAPVVTLDEGGTQFLEVIVAATADPAYPITGYTVEYREVGDSTWLPAPESLSGGGGSMTILGLDSSTEYEIRARATSAGGTSANSATLTVSTGSSAP
ncbi:MAG: fibronectin type III domain-containing protein [Microcella sp.]